MYEIGAHARSIRVLASLDTKMLPAQTITMMKKIIEKGFSMSALR